MTINIDDIFVGIDTLNRWVPYKLVYNPKREKFDKIPHNGRHGLKTIDPADWCNLFAALEIVNENYGLSGVGMVMTDSPDTDGWTLIGFDYDDITNAFKLPIDSYAEVSPSKTGVRQFAWAPTDWVLAHQDTLNCSPPNCAHAEIYVGSAPRFLTVTFDILNKQAIIQLTPKDLKLIESWGMHLRDPEPEIRPFLDTAGTVLKLGKFKLTPDQKDLVAGTTKLNRSDLVMGLIITLLDGGASQEDILATLTHSENLWQYLLDHREGNVDRAMDFAKKEITRAYPKSLPGKKDALIGYNSKWKVIEEKPKADNLKFPMHVYDKAPGLVGACAKWILAASYVPREEFAYAAALATVACLVGPCCTHGAGGRDAKLNLYLTLIGGTGSGKSEAIKGMTMLLNETDAKDCIHDFPASEAALRRQLNVTPNILIKVDEMAHKLESMKDNSNGSSMGRAILEAYDGDRMPPKVYADTKNSLPAVENPFVQIFGGTTDKVWEVVKESHMDDGTLNRFVFVCLPDELDYRFNPDPNGRVPKGLKDKLNTFWRAGKMEDLIGNVPNAPDFGRHITYADDVKDAMTVLNKLSWELQQGDFGKLYPRYVQNTMKVAAILAIGDNRQVVSMKDFEQAQAFTKWSITNTAIKVDAHMANTNYERLEKRLMKFLKKSGGKVKLRDAYKFMHIYRREMDELTATMTKAGLIDMDIEANDVEWLVLM